MLEITRQTVPITLDTAILALSYQNTLGVPCLVKRKKHTCVDWN